MTFSYRNVTMEDKFPIHEKTEQVYSFERLEKLWGRYPQFHEPSVFVNGYTLYVNGVAYK